MWKEKRKRFDLFVDNLDDYLYLRGWYVNGSYIREKCHTLADVEEYLTNHCYSRIESKRIIALIISKMS